MAPPTTHTHDDDTRAAPAARPSQASDLKLSNYLGLLRDDPYDASALEGLAELARTRDAARLGEDPVRLLELARQTHEARGEAIAVARLLEVEAQLVVDDQGFEASLWKELGRVRAEQLLDPEAALAAYERAHELRADDAEVEDAIKRLKQAESSWGKTVKRFVEEAEATEDLSLKSSLLLRAACLNWQYRKRDREKETDKLFERVLELEPGNREAVHLPVLWRERTISCKCHLSI